MVLVCIFLCGSWIGDDVWGVGLIFREGGDGARGFGVCGGGASWEGYECVGVAGSAVVGGEGELASIFQCRCAIPHRFHRV